jgi:predicted RNA-binding Zn ribbon-like protein
MTGSPSATSGEAARPRAPGPLGLLQAFVNTLDIEAKRDEIATRSGLARWLADRQLPGADTVTAADVERARRLRESLRRLLEVNAHLPPARPGPGVGAGVEADDLATAGDGIVLRVTATPAGPALAAAGSGVEAALGSILAAAVNAGADGSWSRLKVCRNDACRWAYWDTSRNRSGVWCTMTVCGNRAKGRSFRARGRATSSP